MAAISPTQIVTSAADAVYLSRRDPPTAPDGQYDWQVDDNPSTTKGNSIFTNIIGAATTLHNKGVYVPNAKAVVCVSLPRCPQRWLSFWLEKNAFIDLAVKPTAIDDRQGAVSNIILQLPTISLLIVVVVPRRPCNNVPPSPRLRHPNQYVKRGYWDALQYHPPPAHNVPRPRVHVPSSRRR